MQVHQISMGTRVRIRKSDKVVFLFCDLCRENEARSDSVMVFECLRMLLVLLYSSVRRTPGPASTGTGTPSLERQITVSSTVLPGIHRTRRVETNQKVARFG